MSNFFADMKYGVRSLLRDKVFTFTVLITLAVCMAANSTTFAIVSSVLLRPLPVPNSHEIVIISNRYPGAGAADSTNRDVAGYYDSRRDVTALSEQAMFRTTGLTVGSDGAPEQKDALSATPSFFRVIGIQPEMGRPFTEEEGEIGAEQKVILTHASWQQYFGGNANAIGKEMRINGRPYEVVGVMPRGFTFYDPDATLIVPLTFTKDQKTAYHNNSWHHIGRIKPGATIEQVQAQINAINAANNEKMPQFKEVLKNAGFHTSVERLQDVMVRDVRGILFLLWGGALFVLLIGALNVANLALVRFSLRSKEIATRLALGAGRTQLIRQFITENVLLTMGGAAAGLAIGGALLRGLAWIGADRLPRANEIHVDPLSIAVSLGIALLIGVALGLMPLASTLRINLQQALHSDARTSTSGSAARAVRRGLVVAQVGFAFVLLLGAGLLLASFRALLHVDPGFRTQGVVTASTNLPRARYAKDPEITSLVERALIAIKQIPGVAAAGATDTIPLSGSSSDSVIFAEGYQMKPGESVISPYAVMATPDYFETMGIGLVSGRYFEAKDNAEAPRVVIVDEQLAKKFWADRDPVGRRMYLPSSPEDVVRPGPNVKWLTVVGVVKPVRLLRLTDYGSGVGSYYFPYAQNPDRGPTFAVRTTADTASVVKSMRAALASLDPDLALFDVRTMQERSELSLSSQRTALSLAMGFGSLAVFLSAVGIYGVLAYHVTQRRREFGIRMALGSAAGDIAKLVLGEAALLTAIGLALGIGGAFGLQKLIAGQLFGVRPLEPSVVGMVIAALALVVAAASLIPARRATRTDPMVVLRSE